MMYERDGFISYAHIDNLELDEGRKGWVARLHSLLEVKVTQRLGRRTQIWRDPKLGLNVELEGLLELLKSAATLAPILSPGYIRSEWCLKELAEFCKAAREQGGLRVQDKVRIFKVLKTPVPLEDQPAELQSLLGYEFFRIDPETGRVRELDENLGPDLKHLFWMRVDDLAEDLGNLLKLIEDPGGEMAVPAHRTVFLAETTSDLREQRDAVKRELRQRGCLVLPDRALPLFAPEVASAVREDLNRCDMSIHMIGRHYSLVPEGGVESLLEVQNNLAIERATRGAFSRLLWIPRDLKVVDERQAAVIEELRMDQRAHAGADLLETSLEAFKTAIETRLTNLDRRREPESGSPSNTSTSLQVYLLYDPLDAEAIMPWADALFTDFEVIHPVFTDDEAENRRAHDEYLRSCDGVMIFYGAAHEPWLRRKLAELQKSAGYGRTKALPEVAICLIAPRTAEKERFRTHQALVIPQWDGMKLEALQPFVSAVKSRGEDGPRDRGGDLV